MSDRILDPGIVAILIPIIAIIMFGTLAIVKAVVHHRERMAKIGMGIDPDARPTEDSGRGRR
jgi:hypothetical protein